MDESGSGHYRRLPGMAGGKLNVKTSRPPSGVTTVGKGKTRKPAGGILKPTSKPKPQRRDPYQYSKSRVVHG